SVASNIWEQIFAKCCKFASSCERARGRPPRTRLAVRSGNHHLAAIGAGRHRCPRGGLQRLWITQGARRCDFSGLLQKQDSNEERSVGGQSIAVAQESEAKPSPECSSRGDRIRKSDWRCPRLRKIDSQSASDSAVVCAGFGEETARSVV